MYTSVERGGERIIVSGETILFAICGTKSDLYMAQNLVVMHVLAISYDMRCALLIYDVARHSAICNIYFWLECTLSK
jgi:hypothetical protein